MTPRTRAKLPADTVSSVVTAVLGAVIEETEVARDRLAKKHGVEASSRFYGSRKSLAAILADQAAVGRQGT
jgi:hypothetical protein